MALELLRLPKEPNPRPKIHLVLFFTKLGGTGGFFVRSFGCAGLYDGISDGASGGCVSPRLGRVIEDTVVDDELDVIRVCRVAVERMGKELTVARGGETAITERGMERVPADDEMARLDCCEVGSDEGEASGNGYSNLVELVAKGVPTICDDGECRGI